MCRLSDTSQVHIPHFVLKNNKGKATILRIQHSSKLLQDAGYNGDLPLEGRWSAELRDAENGVQSPPTIVLQFSQQSTRRGGIDTSAVKALNATYIEPFAFAKPIIGQQKQDILLFWKAGENIHKNFEVLLEVNLKKTEKVFTYQFKVFIDEPAHIFDTVFDFGSEASQMAIDKRKKHQTKRLDLVDLINRNFYKTPFDHKSYYVGFCQYDKNDRGLFLSNFFIKNNGDGAFHQLQKPFEFEHNVLEILKTTQSYNQDFDIFEWMPNLKLMEMGKFRDFDILLNQEFKGSSISRSFSFENIRDTFFEAIINHFFYLLLKGISDEMFSAYMEEKEKLDRPNKIRLTLLVPNIYDQKKVSDLIKIVTASGNKILKKWNEDPEFIHDIKFDGLEVQTMSESDAAFLGLYEQHFKNTKLRKNSNYLIIDGGKATTDLSVIKVEDNAFSFSGSYRGGIAGAGNVLTYAFLENVAAICVGTDTSARKKFIKKIITANFNQLFKVLQAIEKLKKAYSTNRKLSHSEALDIELKSLGVRLHDPTYWRNLNPTDLGESLIIILEKCLIEQNLSLGDYYGIIDHTTEVLVNTIVDKIENLNEYSYTLVNGEYSRQINYEAVILSGRAFMLKDFQDKLVTRLLDKGVIKNAGAIIWNAAEAKKSCIEGPLFAPQGVNRNSDMVGFPVPASLIENNHIVVETEEQEGPNNRLEKFLQQYFNSGKVKTDTAEIKTYLLEDFLINGLPIHSNDKVLVGDKLYRRAEPLAIEHPNEKFNVIFTGEGFKLRSATNSVELIHRHSENNDHRDPLIWKSMFPNVQVSFTDSVDDIIVVPEAELTSPVTSREEYI